MPASLSPPIILLIEDDLDCTRMVQRLLSKHSFTVHHSPTGLVGLQMARQHRPNLVLVDLGLPDLNGNVVALQLRSIFGRKPIPIIAFTAETGVRAQRIAKSFGCDRFLSKPIDTQTFALEISQILNEEEFSTNVS